MFIRPHTRTRPGSVAKLWQVLVVGDHAERSNTPAARHARATPRHAPADQHPARVQHRLLHGAALPGRPPRRRSGAGRRARRTGTGAAHVQPAGAVRDRWHAGRPPRRQARDSRRVCAAGDRIHPAGHRVRTDRRRRGRVAHRLRGRPLLPRRRVVAGPRGRGTRHAGRAQPGRRVRDVRRERAGRIRRRPAGRDASAARRLRPGLPRRGGRVRPHRTRARPLVAAPGGAPHRRADPRRLGRGAAQPAVPGLRRGLLRLPALLQPALRRAALGARQGDGQAGRARLVVRARVGSGDHPAAAHHPLGPAARHRSRHRHRVRPDDVRVPAGRRGRAAPHPGRARRAVARRRVRRAADARRDGGGPARAGSGAPARRRASTRDLLRRSVVGGRAGGARRQHGRRHAARPGCRPTGRRVAGAGRRAGRQRARHRTAQPAGRTRPRGSARPGRGRRQPGRPPLLDPGHPPHHERDHPGDDEQTHDDEADVVQVQPRDPGQRPGLDTELVGQE